MYKVNVKIVGVSPLLMNRFSETPRMRRKAGEIPHDWRETAYFMPGSTTELAQPGIHIEAAMAKAASQFRVAGRGRSTYRDMVRAFVLVEPDMIPHHISLPEKGGLTTDSTHPVYLDMRPVVIQRARIMKTRVALSTGWSLVFTINVLDDQIPAEILHDILLTAGNAFGIGDFRPRFGRFSVEEFK